MPDSKPTAEAMDAAETLWDYHNMHQALRHADIGIGLGSHDPDVAAYTAELFNQGMFPRIVFTGANAPTTIDLFPRGEAVHYAEEAQRLGVPADAILIEPHAANTGENIDLTRALLTKHDMHPTSVTLISRPYQQRRAYATCRKLWPSVDVSCASRPQTLNAYLQVIGDPDRVLNMLVGDTQRIIVYAGRGFAIPQFQPTEVTTAMQVLIDLGYTTRLVRP